MTERLFGINTTPISAKTASNLVFSFSLSKKTFGKVEQNVYNKLLFFFLFFHFSFLFLFPFFFPISISTSFSTFISTAPYFFLAASVCLLFISLDCKEHASCGRWSSRGNASQSSEEGEELAQRLVKRSEANAVLGDGSKGCIRVGDSYTATAKGS